MDYASITVNNIQKFQENPSIFKIVECAQMNRETEIINIFQRYWKVSKTTHQECSSYILFMFTHSFQYHLIVSPIQMSINLPIRQTDFFKPNLALLS